MNYLATNRDLATCGLAESSPTIDDPLDVSIVAELKEEENSLANAIPGGPPWQVVIPTY